MDFAHPSGFWLLTFVPMAVIAARKAWRRRSLDWLLLGKTVRPPGNRSWPWLIVLALLIVAIAGPRWGRAGGYDLPPGHDVVLLVDVSRSMAAEDAVPNRLGAVVKAADGLIDELARSEGDRIAVVAFAGRGVLKCPLTENPTAARDALAGLRPGSVQPGGTDLGAALIAAIDAFDDQEAAEGRSIVVLSDGEDHESSWRKVLQLLKMRKITVHVVAVGDADLGRMVPIITASGKAGDLHYLGRPVVSRRDDHILEALRFATGGVFVPMGAKRANLGQLYRERIAPSAKRRRDVEHAPERIERYAGFVVAALGLILATSWPWSRRVGLLVVLLAVGLGAGPGRRSASRAVSAGEASYRRGEFARSLADFEEAIQIDPNSPVAHYNAAAAFFQMGKYAEAETQYHQARKAADGSLRLKIDYALGNAAVAQGRFKEALTHYDASLSSKASGPGLATIRRDAAANRTFAAKLLPPPALPDPEGDRNSPSNPRRGSGGEPPKSSARNPGNGPGANPPSSVPNPASGAGSNPSDAGTPDDRLTAMLDDVKRAGTAAAEGSPPPEKASGDRKDW